MGRRRAVLVSVGGVLLVALVAGLLLFQPWLLLVDDEVDEADDGGAVVATASAGISDTAVPDGDGTAPVRLELARGRFIDAEHGTSGTAVVYRRDDGTRYLRLEDLDTSNGPDLHVWISDRPSGGDCEGCFDSWGIYDDGDHVALGELKGNQGSQSYEIPDGADLAGMRSVVIWCDRFNVAFGTAPIA
ncbi:DM13 domain-containing protein [Nocardioides sp. TF02-7]|uniref:DM13 domain-containing protein n=1 Tax=Nocardioides sp. TF02-7 TaxID=2917724 RepID=UPI001F05FCC3|nr:DM13 domain-containing protein [Nocardioides sp. TF02-7]UMG92683.1 DM13 domain-containing protein [Nocardioides sp. TF02-7]